MALGKTEGVLVSPMGFESRGMPVSGLARRSFTSIPITTPIGAGGTGAGTSVPRQSPRCMLLSCPHAARMSRPLLFRMMAVKL